MKRIILMVLIAGISFSAVVVNASTQSSISDEQIKTIETYEHGFIIVDTFSTGGIISGIPEYEHVGGLHDLDITTDGGSISLFFTTPIWGSSINYRYDDVHIQMDHFLGVSTSYSSGGTIVGICNNISWELIQ